MLRAAVPYPTTAAELISSGGPAVKHPTSGDGGPDTAETGAPGSAVGAGG